MWNLRLLMASLLAGSGVEAALSQTQQDAVLAKHNELRALAGASDMMMLTWSSALASAAQNASSTCSYH